MDVSKVLEQVYNRHFGLLVTIGVKNYGCDFDTAKDRIQETFVHAWKNRSNIRANTEGGVRSFVIRIFRNTCISHLRKSNPFSEISERRNNLDEMNTDPVEKNFADISSDPLHEILFIEEMRLRKHAVEQLPPKYRKPVELYLEGKKPQDIAEITGTNKSTTRTRIDRGLKKFEKILLNVDPLRKS